MKMIFKQNVLLDYTFDDSVSEVDCNLNWDDFADDYAEIELTYNNEVILCGNKLHDSILEMIDAFLKGVAFSGQHDVEVIQVIKTPLERYYECNRIQYEVEDNG